MRAHANGVAINYEMDGPAGAPVVMLAHPLAARLDVWDAQARALRDRYRVLRYDARGHGGSDVPPGAYTLDQMADDAVGLLDALGIRSAHFVGLSMGGCVGMTAALRSPDRIASLVLADTTSRYAPQQATMWDDRIRTAETHGLEPLIEPTMKIWFTERFRETAKPAVDRVRDMLRATDPRGYVGAIRAIASVNLTDAIAAIRCPTLVIVGRDDPGTTVQMADVMRDRIPGAQLAVLPGAAHCSCVEAADAFTAALTRFLARPATA
ncbi:MAG: 3-oxoadipate enol-lactonase [Candidatus Rokubacteria bacterium]|nr:3-oxoadipate enol-lactonase [Candidatus Rokubacteria bacterium]